MSVAARTLLALWLAIVLITGFVLLDHGIYGWTLFVILPFAVGLLATNITRPATLRDAATVGAYAILLTCLLVLLFAMEGFVCVVLALPLILPLACLGAMAGHRLQELDLRPRSGSALLLLPITAFTWDLKAPPPVFHVTTSVVVNATPEQVWKRVIAFPKLPETRDWIFHTGLAYPTEARITGSGVGSVRYCQFSTGDFVEPITVWEQSRLLRFHVAQNPPPLHERSPWGEINPKHLHGYMISEQGQFELTPLPNGRTLLAGTTWYRHSLWPAEYWRLWSDAIIHRIHLRVLNHVRTLAEADNAAQ